MAEQSDEKEFDPTPQKLLEARRKGEIARSADLHTAASYLGFLIAMYFVFDLAIKSLGDVFIAVTELSADAARLTVTSDSVVILRTVLTDTAVAFLPVFAIPFGFAWLSIFGQRSLVFAPSKVQPKLNRISPIAGLKNKFGRAGLFEFFKSFLKLTLFMIVLALFIQLNFDRIALATQLSPGNALLNMAHLMFGFLAIIVALAFLIGALDFVFQVADHKRKNRMSRKDLQDELKNAEGDPHMKQRRRQKAQALASGQMAEIPNASVVMVNPTHYAVALKWDPFSGTAPIVVARGVDEVALRIRKIADEHNVPIHSDPPGTRALYAVAEIGDPVPREHYEAVAAAIRFADMVRVKQKQAYG